MLSLPARFSAEIVHFWKFSITRQASIIRRCRSRSWLKIHVWLCHDSKNVYRLDVSKCRRSKNHVPLIRFKTLNSKHSVRTSDWSETTWIRSTIFVRIMYVSKKPNLDFSTRSNRKILNMFFFHFYISLKFPKLILIHAYLLSIRKANLYFGRLFLNAVWFFVDFILRY